MTALDRLIRLWRRVFRVGALPVPPRERPKDPVRRPRK